jgi:hypothetical protein
MLNKAAGFLMWLTVGYIGVCFMMGLHEGNVLCAPIPKPKPEPVRPQLHGLYEMSYCGTSYDAYFLKDGEYLSFRRHTNPLETCYRGSWRIKDDRLTVREHLNVRGVQESYDNEFHWDLKKGKWQSTCLKFSLTPIP